MLTIGKNQAIFGSSSFGNVAITIFGEDSSGPRVLYNGYFSIAGEIWAASLPTRVHSINLSAVSGDTTVALFIEGIKLRNRIFMADIPHNGSITYNNAGWRAFDASGIPIGQGGSNSYFP